MLELDMQEKVLKASLEQVSDILTENWMEIVGCLARSYAEHASNNPDATKPFKYNVNLGLELQPRGSDMKVSAKIGYDVKHKDSTLGQVVSMQPELPIDD